EWSVRTGRRLGCLRQDCRPSEERTSSENEGAWRSPSNESQAKLSAVLSGIGDARGPAGLACRRASIGDVRALAGAQWAGARVSAAYCAVGRLAREPSIPII